MCRKVIYEWMKYALELPIVYAKINIPTNWVLECFVKAFNNYLTTTITTQQMLLKMLFRRQII